MMMKKNATEKQRLDIGPFETVSAFKAALADYETIRREGKVNMFALGMFWDKKKLAHIMKMYDGRAQEIIAGMEERGELRIKKGDNDDDNEKRD